jgi:O-antigen/teichoic acid export membrane protein
MDSSQDETGETFDRSSGLAARSVAASPGHGATAAVPDAHERRSFSRMGRNTAFYSFAGLAARVTSVIMLPVYTHYLTPAQYGILALLDVAVDIANILFAAGTRAGLQRFYFKAADDDQRLSVVFTAWVLENGLTWLGALALILGSGFVYHRMMSDGGSPALVQLAALNFGLGAAVGVPMAFLQIKQRALPYSAILLSKLVMQVIFNLLFLVHFGMGVASILLSTMIVNIVLGVGLSIYLLSVTGIRFSRLALTDLRRFGVPYQLATAAAFVLAFGDRFFLEHSHGLAEVGVYGLAYTFGFLLYQIATTPFLRAWEPQRFVAISDAKEERDRAMSRGFLYFNLVVLTVATGLAVYVRPVIAILTSAPYHTASSLVPLILGAYVIQGWGDVTKFGIDVSERTRLYTYASWAAAGVVLVLYATLIPPFGGYGAAIATTIAFAVRFALGYFWSHRVWPISYGWGRVARLTMIAVVTSAYVAIWPAASIVTQLLQGTVAIVVYGLLTWGFVLAPAERRALLDAVRFHSLGRLLRTT